MVKKSIGTKDKDVLVSFILRSGLAVVFLYAGVAALSNPDAWVGFIPGFVRVIIPAPTFLLIHSCAEIVLALWLLSGKKALWAALIAVAAMLSIILFNITAIDVVFRDVAIMFAAIALAVLSYRKN